MRIIKEAHVRQNEILDAAAKLFTEKGYDNTSTGDILAAVGIARGTLYHHFKSKEAIMDALIERQTERLLSAARLAAADCSVPVEERIIRTISALNAGDDEGGEAMIAHLHQPQNALMHQKTNAVMIRQVPPILAGLIIEGTEQGLFHAPYPLECMEMALIYLKTIFDDGVIQFTPEQHTARVEAFIFHLELLLAVEHGRFEKMKLLFESGKNQ